MFDLIISGGRILDPSQHLDSFSDLAIRRGRIVGIGKYEESQSYKTIRLNGELVLPGLIDMHAHVIRDATFLGVDPDDQIRKGVTTVVDAGSLGSANFGIFNFVTGQKYTTVIPFINIAMTGLALIPGGFSDAPDERALDRESILKTIFENPCISGIKVRIGKKSSQKLGLLPLRKAIEAAEITGLKVMCHVDDPPPSIEEVLDLLRPGDIISHGFRGGKNSLADCPEKAKHAQKNGIILDVGHGASHFSFATSKRLLEDDISPDTISSDLATLSAPIVGDLLTTANKFIALGLNLESIAKMITTNPAKSLGIETGTLRLQSKADVAVCEVINSEIELRDSEGTFIRSKFYLRPKCTVKDGLVFSSAN